ncbi:metal-dependent hydrolase [Hydrogenophaga sp.]|uniref:metal-dependent hydrolase n=1 Tax=Hydrogenophaga sp. TaxID=1904254 RepID=UPI0026390C1A|nr:metal-dependent hydrolase [Hydrogenophaga sp.]MDM7949468.1 metal-dependent hydrolase [Hydrogenophaga sp.]
MATFLHFAPALALAVAMGPRLVSRRLMLAGAFCAVLPDADFASVAFGFDSYSGTYGHRGFTHSLGFALLLGVLGAMASGPTGRQRLTAAVFIALCTASHPLLDGLMDRGICNAWAWPLDGARHCLAWRPVPTAGVNLFGWDRLAREALWLGVPLLLLAHAGMTLRQLGPRWWRTSPRWRRAKAANRQAPRTLAPPVFAADLEHGHLAQTVAAARASGGWAGSINTERTRRRTAMRAVGAAWVRKAVV